MFAKYVWINGATLTQVLDDICKLSSGTAIDSLSASCDKVNSTIIANTGANNWTVFDASAAAGAQVLRSLNVDGVSYKYAHLSYSGANFILSTHESWNNTTHVGTNQATNSNLIACAPKAHTAFATTGGTLYIYASDRMLVLMQSNTNSVMVGEFSRDTPALNSTYPCHVVAFNFKGGNANQPSGSVVANEPQAGLTRIKSAVYSGDFKLGVAQACPHSCSIGPIGTANDGVNSSALIRSTIIRPAGSEVPTCQVSDLFVYHNLGQNSGSASIIVGKLQDIYYLEGAPASNLGDEIDISGTTYLLFAANYIVRKE